MYDRNYYSHSTDVEMKVQTWLRTLDPCSLFKYIVVALSPVVRTILMSFQLRRHFGMLS